MSGSDLILAESRGGRLWLTLNRPAQRNALSLALLHELGQILAGHARDPDLRCVVITGSGERAFAAGGDLRELDALRTPDQARQMSRLGRAALDLVRRFPTPVIAALNGPALGGGAELALACDLRVAAANGDIGFLQSQLNVTPAWGGGIDLIAAVGAPRALEILVAARRIAPTEALDLGLVQRACGAGESLPAVLEDFLAVYDARPPHVLRDLKAVNLAARLALHEALAAEEEARFVASWVHPDHWTAAAKALAPRP